MSDEEKEAFSLLQALEDQNNEDDEYEIEEDDEDEYHAGKNSTEESGVDPELLKQVQKNLKKYNKKETDSLWQIISKIHEIGVKRLVHKKERKLKTYLLFKKVKENKEKLRHI